jgi:hypothetical protein
MSDSTADQGPKLDLDWTKTLAGALAAVTTAVLLSTLGAVGTLIGAALGSVAATVGGALYAQGLARSRAAMRRAHESARLRLSPEAERRQAEADDHGWREKLRGLPWRRIGLIAAGMFAAVVIAITAFEAVAGRSVSSYTGGSDQEQGSTIGGVTGGGGGGGGRDQQQDQQQDQDQDDQDQQDGSDDPSESASPSDDEASEEPSEEATPTESATPTPTPSPTPSVPSPTTAPSQAPSPSATS